MSKQNINIDDIKVSLKLDDVIKDAVHEGYSKYKNVNNKNSKFKRSIVAVAVLGIIVLGVNFSDDVVAAIRLAKFNIENYMGLDKDLEDYKTVVDRAITKNGITVQLNEVILDGDEIIVATTEKLNGDSEALGVHVFGDVYINGKKASKGAGGSSKSIDKNTWESVMAYDLDKELLSGDLEIEIEYDKANCIYKDEKEKEVSGNWNFKFIASGDSLVTDTSVVELDESFLLDDGQRFILNEYKSNDVGQKISFSIEDKDKVYDIILKGYDNLGNEVEFYDKRQSKNEGIMKNQTKISEEAEYLLLTPYAVAFPEKSGKMSHDFKKVGEEFTIYLEKK